MDIKSYTMAQSVCEPYLAYVESGLDYCISCCLVNLRRNSGTNFFHRIFLG